MGFGTGRSFRTEVASVTDHGGSLDTARTLFPHAPKPWIDLSTGINPNAYPQLDLPAEAFTRLPEPARVAELCRVAAAYYGASSAKQVVAAPGTQILLPRVASLVPPGRARVLGPTYAEHIRAAGIAGHACAYARDFDELLEADLAIIVNPNNPDGRVIERRQLTALGRHLKARGGLLVVDEAFMDVGPLRESLAGYIEESGAIVLKSFGKFFGLAGIRLGFAIAPRLFAERLNAELGPWAIAGPALEYGLAGLADREWQSVMRDRLAAQAAELDQLLGVAGLRVKDGTSLFRFVETEDAGHVFRLLGEAGILTRRFDNLPNALRFGLPGDAAALQRLRTALAGWRHGHAGVARAAS